MIFHRLVHILNFESLEMRHPDRDPFLTGDSIYMLSYSICSCTFRKPQLYAEIYVLKPLEETEESYQMKNVYLNMNRILSSNDPMSENRKTQ